MTKYRKDGRLDLRSVGENPTVEEKVILMNELSEYGITNVKLMDSGRVNLTGEDNQGRHLPFIRELTDVVSDMRKINIMERKVERKRDLYQLDGYKTKPLNRLVADVSSEQNKWTGSKNYIETLHKILKKSEDIKTLGMNKLDIAYKNQRLLQEAKIDSLGGKESLSKFAGIDLKKYQKRDGTFRSKKLEREFYRTLSDDLIDDDYVTSPDLFYPWLSKQDISIKDAPKELIQELYRDYAEEKLSEMLVAKQLGAKEADNMKFSEEEIQRRLELVKTNQPIEKKHKHKTSATIASEEDQ